MRCDARSKLLFRINTNILIKHRNPTETKGDNIRFNKGCILFKCSDVIHEGWTLHQTQIILQLGLNRYNL